MKKEEFIRRSGEEAWSKRLAQRRVYHKAHKKEENTRDKKYYEDHLEEARANSQEQCRKGGRCYDKHLEYMQTGIPGERHKIREKHGAQWRQYKNIIAPGSQLHHNWVPGTAEYTGLALVEADEHMHGIIDLIEILEGKITLLTEEEVRGRRT
jgi:hypothetical protein